MSRRVHGTETSLGCMDSNSLSEWEDLLHILLHVMDQVYNSQIKYLPFKPAERTEFLHATAATCQCRTPPS